MFHLIHVTAHSRNDVPLPFLREEAQRQRRDLLVNLVAHIPHHACPDRQHRHCSQEIRPRLQGRHYCQEHAYQQQRRRLSPLRNHTVHVVVHIVHQHLLRMPPVPSHHAGCRRSITRLEQYLQDRYQCCKRKYIQHCRQHIKPHAHHQVLPIPRHKPPQHAQKLLHLLSLLSFSPAEIKEI